VKANSLETKIPPLVVALVSFLMVWLSYRYAPDLAWSYEHRQLLAWVFFIVAFIVSVFAVIAFRRAQTTVDPMHPEQASTLVESGIFAYTRNPMYLGMFISLIGVCCYFPTALSPLALIFYVVYMTRFQIIPEERALTSLFGEDYLRYKTRVARWIGQRR